MKIAFFITAHKLERQFEWLFNAIWNPNDIFVIHVNRNSPDAFVSALQDITAGRPNVFYLWRIPITWGGWSIVEATLEGIRFLSMHNEDWGYFVNLSAQDYPVRPVSHLRRFLQVHDGANFLDIRDVGSEPFHIRRRLHWYCVEYRGKLRRIPLPNLRAMLTPVRWYGGLWGMLSREFCEWLVESSSTQAYARALRHTKIPDEFFFQTMIKGSPLAHTLDPDPHRYLCFDKGASGPRTLTSGDFDGIIGSTAFFARKFDETTDAEVLRRLAVRIGASRPAGAQEAKPSSDDTKAPALMRSGASV